jgi:hypothetical protein
MGVIIDQFEVILDSQQGRDAENRQNGNADETAAVADRLKPQDVNAIVEQQTARCERVRAH